MTCIVRAEQPHRRVPLRVLAGAFTLRRTLVAAWAALAVTLSPLAAWAQQQQPNILVIMADDIGYWNVSAYNRGMMGYRTPNIDRIANEGALMTDYYGQQSCTAGRANHYIADGTVSVASLMVAAV